MDTSQFNDNLHDITSDTEAIKEKIEDQDEDQGREYLFNEKTAGVYVEYEVIKISR